MASKSPECNESFYFQYLIILFLTYLHTHDDCCLLLVYFRPCIAKHGAVPVLFPVASARRVPRPIKAQVQTLSADQEAAEEGTDPQEAQLTGNQAASEIQKGFYHSGEVFMHSIY